MINIKLFSLLILLFLSAALALLESDGDSVLSNSLHKRNSALTADSQGICHTYTVQAGDSCAALATQYGISRANIETWNIGVWGWTGCSGLKQGVFMCLGSGKLPMPVALPHATCGPQVPGTMRPLGMSDLGSLNPCHSGACCSKLGTCGTTADFCGTGCVSNCKLEDAPTKKIASSETNASLPSTTSKISSKTTSTTSKKTRKVTTITKKSSTTTEKKATKTTSETPVPAWQLTIYKEKGCKGEEYISLQGHDTKDISCVNLSDNLNTDINDKQTSCRLWTDGGLNWGSCKGQKITQPKSYFITRGQCLVYGERDCATKSYQGDVRNPAVGCQFPYQASWSPEDFVSIRCFDNEYGVAGVQSSWYPDKVING
ncbi:uncharacterized protein N7511_004659 [Penicillium nucicola]|uniref:uncharacterized protein n=1 Tax=Penicillium nucicola TaxID=1850975 RepID=UPI0025453E4F|nr:uncharacterized protein N7511_004659 [Penicillium nucicola]KAJ5767043.1 hypothetical protein N7511_004659 [Penicillium nucicola]